MTSSAEEPTSPVHPHRQERPDGQEESEAETDSELRPLQIDTGVRVRDPDRVRRPDAGLVRVDVPGQQQ